MYQFPKCSQQKQFELAIKELINIVAELTEAQQDALFEYAIQLHTERTRRTFTKWNKE